MMKTYLIDREGIRRIQEKIPWNGKTLINDLGLKPIIDTMASGDSFLLNNSVKYLLNGTQSIAEISYRQNILKDFINNSEIAYSIYENASAFIEEGKKQFFWFSNNDSLSINVSIDIITTFSKYMEKIRKILLENSNKFESEGLKKFSSVVTEEFGKEYMDQVMENLEMLQFKDGVTMSVTIGPGNEGRDYIICMPDIRAGGLKKLVNSTLEKHYTYILPDRDIAGGEEISDIRKRGLGNISMVLKKTSENIMAFFKLMQSEIGFYLAAINLIKKIRERNGNITFPVPERDNRKLSFDGLYDLGLFLGTNNQVISNNLDGNDIDLFIITGTNRGGKSTFIRSIGQAQLMMQAGLFVPANQFICSVFSGVYTHFKHEEDETLERGNFDEELRSMNEIAGHISKGSIMIFNESFSATNTREGSDIAMQITSALIENGIRVFFVSHLYEFASSMEEQKKYDSIFMVAERKADGTHTYKIIKGEPSSTGYGMDLYHRIFD
ncbi:hypothetical protein [Ferroplasma sp.]|uniref:MutS-related protein n=1 Tax=Ferroplasma sp. TaxID=2591003 RepID=UPI00307DF9FA